MNLQSKSLGVEIGRMLKGIGSKFQTYSKQAYSKARHKYKHGLYIELNSDLTRGYYSDDNYKKYKGYRLIAVDGSKIRLPNNAEITAEFGKIENKGKSIPMSLSSVSYDVLNEIVLDAKLEKCKGNERELIKEHIEKKKMEIKTYG